MKSYIQNLRDISDSQEILESRPNVFTSIFVYILIFIIIIAFAWSYFGELEEYVKATGVIRPDENVSTLRNLVGGRVKELNFEEGDRVEKGEAIFTIETENLFVERDKLTDMLSKLERERVNLAILKRSVYENINLFDANNYEQAYFYNRFKKFQTDKRVAIEQFENTMLDLRKMKSDAESSKELTANRLKNTKETKRNQMKLLESVEKDKNLFDADNVEYYGRFIEYELTFSKLSKSYEQNSERYDRLKRLYELGGVPKRQVEDAKALKEAASLEKSVFRNEFKTDLRENIRQNNNMIKELSDTITGLDERLALLRQKRQNAEYTLESIRLGILVQIENALKTNRINTDNTVNDLRSLEISIEKASVKAPIEGILHFETGIKSGDFLYNGMKIGTIIPDARGEFKVQLMVANEDIADIKTGQTIKYRLLAYPFREYGEFEGYVKSIGADARMNPGGGGSYFLVEASIETQGRPPIRVGMLCEARLVTRTRRIILWFLERINLIN